MQIRRNYYYRYICLYDKKTGRKRQIPFKLAHIDEPKLAFIRKNKVDAEFARLKQEGIAHEIVNATFKWNENYVEGGFVNDMTLREGYDFYQSKRNKSDKSKQMDYYTIKHICSFLTDNKICNEINESDLEEYVKQMQFNGRSDTSINMDLRNLRAMLTYLKRHKKITSIPCFKYALEDCPVNDNDPIYISEIEFAQIMDEDWMLLTTPKRDFYKKVFQMYWDLGLRLTEPFQSQIVFKGYDIFLCPPILKKGMQRKIIISAEHALIIKEMQELYSKKPTYDHIKNYSKVFKKALRHCGISEVKHLHSLRHSYGIRRRIETNGNVQQVQAEMGHRTYKTTEKYQRCDITELKHDFPSLKNMIESMENDVNKVYSTTFTSTTLDTNSIISRRDVN